MCENYCLDLDSMPKVLQTLDGVTLSEMDLPPIKYVIKDLLPQGLAMLNGSMKIGKSWMVLDWCVRILSSARDATSSIGKSMSALKKKPVRGVSFPTVRRIRKRCSRDLCKS